MRRMNLRSVLSTAAAFTLACVITPSARAEKSYGFGIIAKSQTNPDITGWGLLGGWPLFTHNALKCRLARSSASPSNDGLGGVPF